MEELNKLLGYISLDAKYKQELLYASLKADSCKTKKIMNGRSYCKIRQTFLVSCSLPWKMP